VHLINFITRLMMIDFLLMILGLNPPLIFAFKIDWLTNKKPRNYILILSLVLFLISLTIGEGLTYQYSLISFRMPIISIVIFMLFQRIFYKFFKRDPVSTFWKFTKMPLEDVVFNILYWVVGAGLPFWIVY